MTDLISSGPDVLPRGGWFADPGTAALIAFPLALLCLFGIAPLSGRTYTLLFVEPSSLSEGQKGLAVLGLLISAAFAVFTLLIARAGLRHVAASHVWWVPSLLRAAVALAALDALLRIIAMALVAVSKTPNAYGLLGG